MVASTGLIGCSNPRHDRGQKIPTPRRAVGLLLSSGARLNLYGPRQHGRCDDTDAAQQWRTGRHPWAGEPAEPGLL